MVYDWLNYRKSVYTIVIRMPRVARVTPTIAVLLCSVFKLYNPSTTANMLATPPQAGIMARQILNKPNEADAMAKKFAICKSGS